VVSGKASLIPATLPGQKLLGGLRNSSRPAGSKPLLELVVGFREGFRDYPHIGYHRHEVSVSLPPGHDMGMDMLIDARPGYLTQIDSDVKTLGVKYLAQELSAPADYLKVLAKLIISQSVKVGHVAIGRHHEVPRVIGVAIHDDKVFAPAVENVILSIAILSWLLTQHTA